MATETVAGSKGTSGRTACPSTLGSVDAHRAKELEEEMKQEVDLLLEH